MATQLDPITPGEILRDEFMAEYGLSQNKLALDLNTPASIVNRIDIPISPLQTYSMTTGSDGSRRLSRWPGVS